MIFTDLVSNLNSKKTFFMYPRFVQEVINCELTDLPSFEEVYVPKPPKGKVFSNMRRNPRDSEGVDTPLFSTMMVVSHHSEGMASGSQPLSDPPTDDQSQPSHSINIPLSPSQQPSTKVSKVFERRKKHKVPSLDVSTTPNKPISPVLEHSPIQNIQRESPGVSPNSKKVHPKEKVVHMGRKATTTSASKEKDSGNINKTFPMATLSKKLGRGPRCPETKGAASASARQKATADFSKDPVKKVTTSETGEDSYSVMELMETMSNMHSDMMAQQKEIDSLKKVALYQQKQLDNQRTLIFKLLHKKKRSQFVLKKKKSHNNDAPKKGEMEKEMETREMEMETTEIEPNMQMFEHMEVEKKVEKEIAEEEGETAVTVNTAEAEPVVTEEPVLTEAPEAAVIIEPAVVNEPAAVTEAVVIRQPVETVNAAELASQILVHLFAKDINDIVSEGLEEMVLRKADRLLKKFAQTQLSAELSKPVLKRIKMMTKKRKSSLAEIEERKVKRMRRREEREEKKRYCEQRRIVLNPNPQQPIEADPLDAQPPEIVHWDTWEEEESDKDYIRIKRADGKVDVERSWIGVLRKYTRADLEEMHKVGKVLYGDLLGEDVEFSYCKMIIEHLCCMFEPETIDYLIRRPFEKVVNWTLHENCAVYSILLDTGLFEFYLVERIYRHSLKRLNGMMAVKLKCKTDSAMGEYLVKRTLNQQMGLDPNLGLN